MVSVYSCATAFCTVPSTSAQRTLATLPELLEAPEAFSTNSPGMTLESQSVPKAGRQLAAGHPLDPKRRLYRLAEPS